MRSTKSYMVQSYLYKILYCVMALKAVKADKAYKLISVSALFIMLSQEHSTLS